MAITGAVADHDGPMLAELFIGQWLLRLSQRVGGGNHENIIQCAEGLP